MLPETCYQPLIPVMDMMIGQVVLASGGMRDLYQPVESKLTLSSRPQDVAQAIHCQTGCRTFYLADIDSFAGAEPNWEVYRNLLTAGFRLWIDADWWRTDNQENLKQHFQPTDQVKLIISSETIRCWEDLKRIEEVAALGIEPVMSIDQCGGKAISRGDQLTDTPVTEWVHRACGLGVDQVILIDLLRIGTGCGFESDDAYCCLLRELIQEYPHLKLTTGGGIRNAEDAKRLLESGCESVLCATAIHDCRFTPDDVDRLIQVRSMHV